MALAIKRIHNLPPHLSYVSTLPDVTQKPKRDTDKPKQRLIDTWDRIPQGIVDEAVDQWQTRLHACVKKTDVTWNTYCDLSTQPALFNSDTTKPVLFRANHTIERKTI